ncbi:AMP phosphorylase [Natronocalculus amylovorans]|uniref:AMP phosphorylase n=1 Tax=Natronocalculus amylovorans TaxID=2917812 RepID=A0AAE3K9G0_9EURY|nr:AMP phosphorylase [Natronocalculus amylovorans]MCL9818036.1 AMP phosphorylase [Natronocalculus amylovorans]
MELSVVPIDLDSDTPTVVLHGDDAIEIGVHPMDRVQLTQNGGVTIGVVKETTALVDRGEVGLTQPLSQLTGTVTVKPAPYPQSMRYIRRKLDDNELSRSEIRTIVQDINNNRLTDVELSAYVTGIYTNGLSLEETTFLTECMADVGDRINWDEPVIADKHSIGGVPGNRTTPIVVAIVAAAGVKIPKTSSRAITSPAGTADTMEVFCPVDLTRESIERVVRNTNGCLVWGGSVDLSPVDDRIIQVETPLSIDPHGQVIASVLSKKRSAGSTHVVIDIPYGEGAKVESLPESRKLARDFKRVGEHLGMRVTCLITRGSGPIGSGIGPALEARDVLAVLEGTGPGDLRSKSVQLAAKLLELCDVDADADELLASGHAAESFRQIVDAQGGDSTITTASIPIGEQTKTVYASRDGVVTHIDNSAVSDVARRAGAPKDIEAGIVLHENVGTTVSQGDRLFTIHAQATAKLNDAVELADRVSVYRILHPDETLIEQVG